MVFIEKRLHETYSVYKDQQLLADKNLDFFQNYLFSVIPPNLFDFFFFDGEEIGDFFATGNYSNYIKNAVLTLSGYDTFNIIQKFCDSYIGEEGNEDYDQVAKLVEQEEANLCLCDQKQRLGVSKAAADGPIGFCTGGERIS